MCYFSAEASEKVDAQKGHVLQVKRQMHGTKWLMLAKSRTVACLKPGTEVEISKVPFIWRWRINSVEAGSKALFRCLDKGNREDRDVFLFPDGQTIPLQQLPQRLKMTVTAVPVSQAPRREFPDFEALEKEFEGIEVEGFEEVGV
jgi:hypothetical protein